jgi:ParB-like nuclease domain
MATSTTTDTVAGVHMIALSEIRHDQNVRQELLGEEVDALAQSIALLGQLTPVSVRPDRENGGYVLIAGHKRYAALAQLGHTEIRAEVRQDGEHEASERATENIVRSQLNPYEEAIAVKAISEVSDIGCYAKSGVIRSRAWNVRCGAGVRDVGFRISARLFRSLVVRAGAQGMRPRSDDDNSGPRGMAAGKFGCCLISERSSGGS